MKEVETCGKRTEAPAGTSTKYFPSIDEEVVGFEKDAESIIQQLTGGTKGLDVISIFGMPGLGKTTLARKVYNNHSIVNHFDVKIWCAVSQAYNRRMLLSEIFKQATRSEIDEDDDIADKLRKSLMGKRYLIVLDDIWEIDAWDNLGLCFPRGEDGSRVMVTTRIEEVAKHLQHRGDPYSLRFLTLEVSWELLQKKVFQGESCPPDLLEAGLQVAQHCKGLPLVIVLTAGIIAKMEREASLWFEVAKDLSSQILGEQSMKVIQSSYEHLEHHLKPCLLYMGLFPEDCKIPVSDLLKLWMAEEFVLNIDKENMEEASRICLNDLLNRSLVMVSERRINGDVEYCTIHDVVREFCCRKLREETFMQLTVPYNPYKHLYPKELRFCTYIHDDHVNQLDHSEYLMDKIPSFDSKGKKCYGQCPRFLEFIAHPKFNTWKGSVLLPLLVELRLVRALNLLDVQLPRSWAGAVHSLVRLRYLAIFVEEFEFKWVSHLDQLQTLEVSSTKKLRTSPAIWKMTKLRHVNIRSQFSFIWENNDREILEESSEAKLENLKTFRTCRICMDGMNPRFWWRFPNLEELSLSIAGVPSHSLFPIPEVHTRLQSLELYLSDDERYLVSVEWTSYFVFPSNLRDSLGVSAMNLKREIEETTGCECLQVLISKY
ncbi:putative late blight resistance protein homolog R1B-17 isoform X2 [Lycium barbarum]|uniref:putative late blight resistance protein homolog R1B-17 isoform X2 n=1 Tax=Lycium barbarum TaxID=112863 RepID=UPI00293E5036|nr:putative late blight resistance protein homolog R1B-17 isoform X2 [Lycium barbarum]XP_060194813.1 putative late blight resistance protein homolog R1B-17 isoform X2 [Lycium barbarum]